MLYTHTVWNRKQEVIFLKQLSTRIDVGGEKDRVESYPVWLSG